MRYDAIIVGGGIAGLTSAAFLAKSGYKVMLCEKENHIGGLVSSFKYGIMSELKRSSILASFSMKNIDWTQRVFKISFLFSSYTSFFNCFFA